VSWRFDHVVNVVKNLDKAVDRYTKAGFAVIRGGRHPGAGVENALIGLADGAYIELFSFVDPSTPQPSHPNWAMFAAGGGLATFWLGTETLEADIEKVRALGVTLEDARSGSRVRPDGYEVKFRLAVPSKVDYPYVPAIITDVTPRSERLPPPAKHPNGVRGIASVAVRVGDIGVAKTFYEGLGGVATTSGNSVSISLAGKRLDFHPVEERFGIESFGFTGVDGKEIAHATLIPAE
jgi:catechol 2,3-dioxygenase-like lactoylglutathione lyase family enzyme